MQQNGLYWALFAPMIKSSIRNRYGKDLAERAIKNGKAEYRTLVSEAPELGRETRWRAMPTLRMFSSEPGSVRERN